MTEGVVTRKGQVTIPIEIRRKYGLEEGSRIRVVDEGGKIVITALPSIFSLAGSGAGKVKVREVKELLDKMREEDV